MKTQPFDLIEDHRCFRMAVLAVAAENKLSQKFLLDRNIPGNLFKHRFGIQSAQGNKISLRQAVGKFGTILGIVDKGKIKGKDIIEDNLTHRCQQIFFTPDEGAAPEAGGPDQNTGMQIQIAQLVRCERLFGIDEDAPLTPGTFLLQGEVVAPQHHILGWGDHRTPVLGIENILCSQHEQPCFGLRLRGKGYMNRHLVAVKIGIVGHTDQGMDLDRPPLDQHRFKGLDPQTVQGRGPVEQDWMILDHLFECIPDNIIGPVDQAASGLDIMGMAGGNNLFHDKWFEELQGHFLG